MPKFKDKKSIKAKVETKKEEVKPKKNRRSTPRNSVSIPSPINSSGSVISGTSSSDDSDDFLDMRRDVKTHASASNSSKGMIDLSLD